MGRMRSDLDAARGQLGPASGRGRPTPRPRSDGPPPTGANDVVGTFTDRMNAILQSAEEEAAEIRKKARAAVRADEERAAGLRAAVRAEEDAARRTLVDLVRQRDAVLAELTRVRGQLEGLLSGPTARITLPTQETGPDRREMGTGQPLPGTPDLFPPAPEGEPVTVAAGPPATPDSTSGSSVGRPAAATAVLPTHSGASPESPGEPDAAETDRAAPPAQAEQTLLAEKTIVMEPLGDEPPPEAVPVESTQAVATEAGGPAAHEPDAGDPAATPGEATQVAPASPARSG
jgi:syndecan 1